MKYPVRCWIVSQRIALDGEGNTVFVPDKDGEMVPKIEETRTDGYVLNYHLIRSEGGATTLFYEVCDSDGKPNLLMQEFIIFNTEDLELQ